MFTFFVAIKEMSGRVVQIASGGGKNVCVTRKGDSSCSVVQKATKGGKNVTISSGKGGMVVQEASDDGYNYCDLG